MFRKTSWIKKSPWRHKQSSRIGAWKVSNWTVLVQRVQYIANENCTNLLKYWKAIESVLVLKQKLDTALYGKGSCVFGRIGQNRHFSADKKILVENFSSYCVFLIYTFNIFVIYIRNLFLIYILQTKQFQRNIPSVLSGQISYELVFKVWSQDKFHKLLSCWFFSTYNFLSLWIFD